MPADLRSRQPAGRFVSVHVDDLDRVPLDHGEWRPVRRPLDITGFSANAYSGREPGDPVIEPHDEGSAGSGRHEELYVVLAGAASFIVGDEVVDAPAGTLVFVPPGVHRQATAAAPDTTVLVVGGKPGAALPVSPFEHWYAAEPAYRAGDYRRAAEIASAGLTDWPDNAGLNYQLACYLSLAGEPERALEHLRQAVAANPRTREWAATDHDLDPIRDDPGWPS
jgi:mannose-6-phosphate isomerase-like protein (cupin superfamily)